MRQIALALFVLLFSLTAQAQENKTPEQKPAEPATTADTEKPKNEVEKMIAKAQKKGERVIACSKPCNLDQHGEELGFLNGYAESLTKPAYPAIARAAFAQGTVEVAVLIDFDGKVIAASAISGHPLLQATCVQAARSSLFKPTKLDGQPVKVTGVIQYNFVAQ